MRARTVAVAVVALGLLAALAVVVRVRQTSPAGRAPPRSVVERPPPEVGESRIALVARLPLATVKGLVDRELPDPVLSHAGEELAAGWVADLEVRRRGGVSVGGDARGRLVLGVPLDLEVVAYPKAAGERRAKRGKDVRGPTLTAGLDLSLAVDYALDADWRADPQVEVTHGWAQEPRLALGPLKVGVRKPVDAQLTPKLAEAGAEIRAKLMAQDELRDEVERAWADLHRPSQTPDGAWMAMTPRTLSVGDPRVVGDALEIPIALGARVRLVVGERPPDLPVPPLPARVPPEGPPGLRIAASIELPWATVSDEVAAVLASTPFESDVGTVRATGAELYPSGERVALGVSLALDGSGPLGTVWFLGRPVLDAASTSVRLEDFDYTVQAGGSWMETANHETLRDTLRAQAAGALVFPYGDGLAERVAKAGARPPKPGMTLDLQHAEVTGIALTEASLRVDVVLQGDASLVVDPTKRPGGRR